MRKATLVAVQTLSALVEELARKFAMHEGTLVRLGTVATHVVLAQFELLLDLVQERALVALLASAFDEKVTHYRGYERLLLHRRLLLLLLLFLLKHFGVLSFALEPLLDVLDGHGQLGLVRVGQ
jgi:hypothetical protein